MHDFEELRREEWRLERLKYLVDGLCVRIIKKKLTWNEALTEAELVRERAQALAPDQMDLYDLIYGSRIKRLMQQFLTQPET
jgi:hypothetical protein